MYKDYFHTQVRLATEVLVCLVQNNIVEDRVPLRIIFTNDCTILLHITRFEHLGIKEVKEKLKV